MFGRAAIVGLYFGPKNAGRQLACELAAFVARSGCELVFFENFRELGGEDAMVSSVFWDVVFVRVISPIWRLFVVPVPRCGNFADVFDRVSWCLDAVGVRRCGLIAVLEEPFDRRFV